MKIYHVVRQYHPSIGGLEDVVYNISKQQLICGQEAVIITLDRLFRGETQQRLPKKEFINGIMVIRLPYFGSSRYPICLSVLNAISDADIVHVHGVDFFYDFLALTQWWHGKQLVASTHGIFFHTSFASNSKKIFFNTMTRLSSLFYQKVYATSENDGELFKKITRCARIRVIENGVDVDKFNIGPRLKKNNTIIYFGRWSENKGLFNTLGWFHKLHSQYPEWRLIIAGREYDHTKKTLSDKIQSLNLSDAVELIDNPDNLDLQQLLQRSSYFICQSRHEGFGLAAIEAMSAGLIPILSNIPPFTKLIKQSGYGLSFSENDTTMIEKLIAHHQQSDDAYHAMTDDIVAYARTFSWQRVAKQYIDEYRRIFELSQTMVNS